MAQDRETDRFVQQPLKKKPLEMGANLIVGVNSKRGGTQHETAYGQAQWEAGAWCAHPGRCAQRAHGSPP